MQIKVLACDCCILSPASVGYELTTYTTSEGQGSLELSIIVFFTVDGAPRPFTLSVNTEDGSAGI